MNCQKSEQRNDSLASDEYFAEGFSGGNNCEAPHKRAARSKLFDAARRSVIKNLLKECDGHQRCRRTRISENARTDSALVL